MLAQLLHVRCTVAKSVYVFVCTVRLVVERFVSVRSVSLVRPPADVLVLLSTCLLRDSRVRVPSESSGFLHLPAVDFFANGSGARHRPLSCCTPELPDCTSQRTRVHAIRERPPLATPGAPKLGAGAGGSARVARVRVQPLGHI